MRNETSEEILNSSLQKMRAEPTYVILGVQGSGTNFISQLMAKALQFSVVIDRSLIFDAAVRVCQQQTKSAGEREAIRVYRSLFPGPIRKRMLSRKYFRQAANYEGIEKHLSHASTASGAEFADFFYGYHAFNTGGKHKAIKSDDIWQNLNYLEQVIPDYRIILLVRDPRDNALSVANKNFGPRDLYFASRYIRFQLEIYAAHLEKSPDRILCIKYEDLLTDPMSEVEKLAEFVGEPVTPEVVEHVSEVFVKRGNSLKWKQLSQKDLIASESVLREQILRFGYECATREGDSLGRLEIARRRASDVAQRVPQKLGAKAARLLYG
ncbi:sulfotransferase family protein [Roseiconus nitratireducens]|nr:sulfotransferase [Roseiconus nitratireducens]